MHYLVYENGINLIYSGDNLDEMEKSLVDQSRIDVRILLPLSLFGSVIRSGQEEKVILTSGERKKEFLRNTTVCPKGELAVSCDPNGEEVPVDAINISFRPFKDPLTDRGMVWVRPAELTHASFTLYFHRLRASDQTLRSVVAAAEKAVYENVLKYFPEPTSAMAN